MNVCFIEQSKETDRLLGQLLKDLRARMQEAGTEQQYVELEQVQAAWLESRDADCGWEGEFYEGGTIQSTIVSTCEIRMTWERIDLLKVYMCDGWGMHIPCAESRRYDRPQGMHWF